MSQRVPAADWAATVPWSGVKGAPPLTGVSDLSEMKWAGVNANRYPVWNGTRFVPTTLPSSSSSTTIGSGAAPGIAVRRRPPGNPSGEFQNVWARYEYNVKQFGATGDGGTDDSQAINAAIYAMAASGGGTLYFPAGTYLAPNIQEIGVRARVRGDGIGVTQIDANGGTALTFFGSDNWFGVDNLSITDCSIAVNAQSGSLWAHDLTVDCSSRGFLLGSSGALSAGKIEGVFFYSTGTAIAVEGQGSQMELSHLHILGTEGPWERGIDVSLGEEWMIHDCYFAAVNQNAIRLQAAVSDCRIHDITVKDITGTPILLNEGTNNFISGIFGLGGNTETLYDDRKELVAAFDWAPGAIPAGYGYYDNFTMAGVSPGDQMAWGSELTFGEGVGVFASAYASDVARIVVMNFGTAEINLASAQWRLRAFN